ncbi:MAG: TolC family protein [Bacteriovoracaceae bacterium]|nr:TolC family protein [Bacteriovoracaceae bacterium]
MTLKTAVLLLICVLVTLAAQSQETIYIDESFLKESLKSNPPTVDQLNAALLGARAQETGLDDKFNTNLDASASYYKTDEKQFATFIPVTSPVKNYEVKISRRFSSGVTVGLRGFADQFSNNFVQDASTTGLSLQLGVNLWKDLFSKRTQSQLNQASAYGQQAQWQNEIGLATFNNTLRKIYWSIVANEEALKISEGLLDSSLLQVKEAKRRKQNNIADSGEVARYQSQVASRQASIISLKYEKASLIKSLKELLPDIALNEIKLKPYNIDETVKKVLVCTATIASESQPPLNFTKYDEIVALLDRQANLEKKINDTYDDIDVQFQTEYGVKGRANSGSDSINDLQDDGRNNVAVGLTLSIPLENKKKTTQEILNKASKLKFRSQKQRELAKIKAYHTQTVSQIALLQQIIRNQRDNTKYLGISLKTSKKKYNQARLTVEQLVQEQDSYLQSNLDEIRTKLAVINTIIDYLSVYTDTPCPLNNI